MVNTNVDRVRQRLCCSFCEKDREQVRILIAGLPKDGGIYICDECVAQCNKIIDKVRTN